jgi:sugar phosphate isomerase/epimerase
LLRLNHDVAYVFTYSNKRLRPEIDLEDALGHVVYVHLKDVVSDQHGWRFVAIGEGSLAMAAVSALIASRLPNTPITLELPLRPTRPGPRDPVRATNPLPLGAARGALVRFLETTALGSLQGRRDHGAPG